jgi:hypothetical protein
MRLATQICVHQAVSITRLTIALLPQANDLLAITTDGFRCPLTGPPLRESGVGRSDRKCQALAVKFHNFYPTSFLTTFNSRRLLEMTSATVSTGVCPASAKEELVVAGLVPIIG